MRVVRALLHLYPRSFRAEYGDELIAVFRARLVRHGPRSQGCRSGSTSCSDTVDKRDRRSPRPGRQDVRSAAAHDRPLPGFSITVVLVAALGIGATAAAFAVTDHVLLRPLPFPGPIAW